jgi:hypothetical protein
MKLLSLSFYVLVVVQSIIALPHNVTELERRQGNSNTGYTAMPAAAAAATFHKDWKISGRNLVSNYHITRSCVLTSCQQR